MKSLAAQAAETAYLNLKSKTKFVPQSNNTNLKNKKINSWKYYGFIFIFLPVLIPITWQKTYEVKGTIHVNGNFIRNMEIFFCDENKKISSVKSGNKGEFKINLTKGNYKIFFKKIYTNEDQTPFSLKLSRNLENLKIYIPKK